MFYRLKHAIVITLSLMQCGGAQSTRSSVGKGSNADYHTVYIIQEAWHTGIILETSTIPDSLWPNVKQFSQSRYLDIGWGDEVYYQEPGLSIHLAIRAAILPTKSVIRVRGLWLEPERLYGNSTSLFKIIFTQEQYFQLLKYIANSFVVCPEGNLILSQRIEGTNNFFLAKRKYHLFRTCNTWVANALKESSFNIRTSCVITRRQLARNLKRIS